MAERRMFAKTIIDSDAFLDMPLSSQALYFHLSMRADDDGFINNPKKIQRMIGCGDDDLKMLIAKRFIIPFESGIVVIKHWKIHNFIRNDRYKETVYQKEKALLTEKENKSYTLTVDQMDTNGIPTVDQMDTQYRLGKERDSLEIEKEDDSVPQAEAPPRNTSKVIDYSLFQNTYNEVCTNLSKCMKLTDKRKKAIQAFLKQLTFEDFKKACEIANAAEFTTGKNDRGWKADFDFLITPDKALKVLEGKYNKSNSATYGASGNRIDTNAPDDLDDIF